MNWQIAFVIVGCVWALVILYTVRTEWRREIEKDTSWMKEKLSSHEKEIEWLKLVLRKQTE